MKEVIEWPMFKKTKMLVNDAFKYAEKLIKAEKHNPKR